MLRRLLRMLRRLLLSEPLTRTPHRQQRQSNIEMYRSTHHLLPLKDITNIERLIQTEGENGVDDACISSGKTGGARPWLFRVC